MSDKPKKRARALQERTGWSYSECRRVMGLGLSPEALEALIAVRKPGDEARRAAIDWQAVEAVMGRCVRGKGYEPTARELVTIQDALKADPAKYRELHARVKGEAVREMTLSNDDEKRGAS